MKIYVVVVGHDFEGCDPYGIWDSAEKALQHRLKLKAQHAGDYVEVEEYDLNSALEYPDRRPIVVKP